MYTKIATNPPTIRPINRPQIKASAPEGFPDASAAAAGRMRSSGVTTSTLGAPAGGDPGTTPLPGSNVPKTAYDKTAPIVPVTRDSTRNTTKKFRKFLDHTSNMLPRMLPTVARRGKGVGAYGYG